MTGNPITVQPRRNTLRRIRKYRALYALLAPTLLYYTIFHYLPYAGLSMAFMNFSPAKGFFNSKWVGWDNFALLFSMRDFYKVLGNTLIINVYKLVFCFPAPIIFALLLNEIGASPFKKTIQLVTVFPHFLSWVVFGGLVLSFVVPGGPVAQIVNSLGYDGSAIATNSKYFRSIVVISSVIKSFGFGSIVYLAALAGINPSLYEAARIDGANRWKQMLHISLPGIRSTIIVLFVLEMGYMMDAGFEQIFVLYNPAVYNVGDVIDTYVYRMGLQNARFSMATAFGLFKGSISFLLIVTTNFIVKRMGEDALW